MSTSPVNTLIKREIYRSYLASLYLILLSFEENGLRIKSMTADLLNKAAIPGFRSLIIQHKSKSSAQRESKLMS